MVQDLFKAIRLVSLIVCVVVGKPQPTTKVGCDEFESDGYHCTPRSECRLSECLTKGSIPSEFNLTNFDIRSGDVLDCDVEEAKFLELLCIDIRTVLDDDTSQICCHKKFHRLQPSEDSPHIPSDKPPVFGTPTPDPPVDKTNPHDINKVIPPCGRRGYAPRSITDKFEETYFEEWPHMCAIMAKAGGKNKNFIAGASLIAPGIVLTAAHSVFNLTTEEFVVRCGDWDISNENDVSETSPHEERNPKKMALHPAFDRALLYNDFAVIELQRDFPLRSNIGTICLPNDPVSESEIDPQNCLATGWGRIVKTPHDEPGHLRQVNLPIVDRSECENQLKTNYGETFLLHDSFICAGGREGEDTCKGDGGSPLICKVKGVPNTYQQTGIVAWGVKCGRANIPGVYASIQFGLCFIEWSTKCLAGDKYNGYFNISGCSNWIDEEMTRLKSSRNAIKKFYEDIAEEGIEKKIAKKSWDKAELYLKNVDSLKKKCISRVMTSSSQIQDSYEEGDIRSGLDQD